jgi:hypothetical protein
MAFTEGDLAGLEITAHGFTVRDYVDGVPPRELLGKNMTSWNRTTEDGTPIPPGLDSLLDEEPSVMRELCQAYQKAVLGISDPLPEASGDGQPYPEESIPMEVLSGSHTS